MDDPIDIVKRLRESDGFKIGTIGPDENGETHPVVHVDQRLLTEAADEIDWLRREVCLSTCTTRACHFDGICERKGITT